MFEKTYRNEAGKSFTEGRKMKLAEFLDYYNTLTDEEWDKAIEMAAKKGYDISNIKAYIRVYGDSSHFEPMNFEEARVQLLELHGGGPVLQLKASIVSIEEERREITEAYATMGLPVPQYWKDKLWK